MVVLTSMLMLTTTSLTRTSTAASPDCGVMLLSLLASRHVGEDAEDRVADLVRLAGREGRLTMGNKGRSGKCLS